MRRRSGSGAGGLDDEVGALNFITPADIVAAARLVRRGEAEIAVPHLDALRLRGRFEVTSSRLPATASVPFFFTAPPLNVTHGTGSPINPLAIK